MLTLVLFCLLWRDGGGVDTILLYKNFGGRLSARGGGTSQPMTLNLKEELYRIAAFRRLWALIMKRYASHHDLYGPHNSLEFGDTSVYCRGHKESCGRHNRQL